MTENECTALRQRVEPLVMNMHKPPRVEVDAHDILWLLDKVTDLEGMCFCTMCATINSKETGYADGTQECKRCGSAILRSFL